MPKFKFRFGGESRRCSQSAASGNAPWPMPSDFSAYSAIKSVPNTEIKLRTLLVRVGRRSQFMSKFPLYTRIYRRALLAYLGRPKRRFDFGGALLKSPATSRHPPRARSLPPCRASAIPAPNSPGNFNFGNRHAAPWLS